MKKVQLLVDQLLNKLFNKGIICIEKVATNGRPIVVHYRRFRSVRIGLCASIFEIGEKQTVVYTFDDQTGKVISRKKLLDVYQAEGYRVIVGDEEVRCVDYEYQSRENTFLALIRSTRGEVMYG